VRRASARSNSAPISADEAISSTDAEKITLCPFDRGSSK
jgi:hypothetical protein